MHAKFLFNLTVFIIAAAVISCTEDDGPVQPVDTESVPPVYIDQSLVVDTSVSVEYSGLAADHAVFDVSDIPMFANGEYDDIYIDYMTLNVPDEEHLVFNFAWRGWNILVPGRGYEWPIQPAPGLHGHMFSEMGLPLPDFLDDSLHIWLRPYFFHSLMMPSEIVNLMNQGQYRLKGVTYHRGYNSARVPIPFSGECGGFAYDGDFYWLISYRDYLIRFSSSGELAGAIRCEMTDPMSLAATDNGFLLGDILYGAEITGLVRKLDLNGDEIDQFSLSEIIPAALLMDDSAVWVANGRSGQYDIFRLDAAASFAENTAVIEDTIHFDKKIIALAFCAADLLVAADSLYVLTRQGERIKTFAWTIGGVRGMSYNSGDLHILGEAPVGLRSDQIQITRLKMR